MNLFDALIMLVEIVTGRTIVKLARKDKPVQWIYEPGEIPIKHFNCRSIPSGTLFLNGQKIGKVTDVKFYPRPTDDELIDYHETKRIFVTDWNGG